MRFHSSVSMMVLMTLQPPCFHLDMQINDSLGMDRKDPSVLAANALVAKLIKRMQVAAAGTTADDGFDLVSSGGSTQVD